MSNPNEPCPHNNVKRKGRLRYICQDCGADVTLEVVLLAESDMREEDHDK